MHEFLNTYPHAPYQAFWVLVFLGLLLRGRRWLGGASGSAKERAQELKAYRRLIQGAQAYLKAGRLTDAKLVIDEKLWAMRAKAHERERSRYIPSEVRREVWHRDGGQCVRCHSEEDLQYDHIIAWSRGGGNSPSNLELLCGRCNRAKSNRVE